MVRSKVTMSPSTSLPVSDWFLLRTYISKIHKYMTALQINITVYSFSECFHILYLMNLLQLDMSDDTVAPVHRPSLGVDTNINHTSDVDCQFLFKDTKSL